MAPGTKKGGKKSNTHERRSSSRQSTPLSTIDTAPPTPQTATPTSAAPTSNANMPKETAYIHTFTAAIVSHESTIEVLIERSNSNNAAKNDPPSSRELHALHKQIKETINRPMTKRGEVCDRSMRQLAQKRKERIAAEREAEAAQAEEAARAKREEQREEAAAERKKNKKVGKKRSHDEMDVDTPAEAAEEENRKERRDSLPSVGAHGVARQDGVGVEQGADAPPSPIISPGRPSIDLMDTAASPSDSEASQTDLPSTAPLYERAFGKDPTLFDDPTIYDIQDLRDDMTEEEKRDILNVAHWPESDLHELTAGEPPDCDFSNAKPANQVNFSTFQTYVEPYIRAYTEEDVAFLKERGDRSIPYLIPQRGARGYKEVWASEDGMDGVAPPKRLEADPNEARGSMEEMNDDVAETDEVSLGPVMNRLLSIIRPSPNNSSNSNKKEQPPAEDADGDTTMVNGDVDTAEQAQAGAPAEDTKPTTTLPPDAPRPPILNQADYETIEARAIQELRYIGFLGPNDVADSFALHNDDEVAARLRTLQHELRKVSRANNVRKARVLELTEERMAMQEYANIAEDLDGQVNAAYLKRNRSLAKPGSKKGGAGRPSTGGAGLKGIAGAAGAGGRGVSDGVRALMQKRRDWIEMVGPVVAFGRPPIPGDAETLFDESVLRRLEKVERELEVGDEGEG